MDKSTHLGIEAENQEVITNEDIDISVLIPVYNEEGAIALIVKRIHDTLLNSGRTYEVLVINDGSQDRSAELAEEAGAVVISHPYNIGNGAAVKTGIRNARGEIIVLLDGDGQHSPEDIPHLLIKVDNYDLVVGARNSNLKGYLHRNLANWIYNQMATYVCGIKILDLTSGFRAINANVARSFVYLLPNTFSYPTTITMATIRSGYSLAYVPIQVKQRIGKTKIKLIRDGLRFLLIILKIATFFSPLKIFVPASLVMFLMGFGYGLFKVLVLGQRYGPTSAMLMTMSVMIFLIGLVSEQVAQLRFDKSELRK